MKSTFTLAGVLALTGSTSAHSWVEQVQKIAPNGTMVGPLGYARGWVPRTTAGWGDKIPQWLLPLSGQSAYSGDEILNKYPFQANPSQPMLQASAGDHIAILHMENGHTSLPQNQPLKPHNRGTIFFYGTSKPNAQEKLFDVHLRWNRDGTGGDKRGVLLATRNYDDGNCYQPNSGQISTSRAQKLASDGAQHGRELICQSDVKLPSDLAPGSIYTIYWYWDWPDLNAKAINLDATKNGIYPWAGTFMRGEKDPHGFTMAAIARNESYASTIDIKITSAALSGSKLKAAGQSFVAKQNIYSMAIESQMKSNYQVNIDANGAAKNPSNGDNNPVESSAPTAPTDAPIGATQSPVTVTKTVTVAPPAVTKTETVYLSMPAETSILRETVTSHIQSQPTNGYQIPQLTSQTSQPASPTTSVNDELPAASGGVYIAPVPTAARRRRWRIARTL